MTSRHNILQPWRAQLAQLPPHPITPAWARRQGEVDLWIVTRTERPERWIVELGGRRFAVETCQLRSHLKTLAAAIEAPMLPPGSPWSPPDVLFHVRRGAWHEIVRRAMDSYRERFPPGGGARIDRMIQNVLDSIDENHARRWAQGWRP